MSHALTLSNPHDADALRADCPGDDEAALPAWLYRSEAFAEDLPVIEPVVAVIQHAAALPHRPVALYVVTLLLAVASSVPSAWLLA